MAAVEELIRSEADGSISFGNHTLSEKAKVEDFSHEGDLYKVKTYRTMTKLEKNGMFAYESVPGTSVLFFNEREDGVIELDATIYCEKSSHKGIIIGKNGAMLKKIGEMARKDMETLLDTKVYLQTWVKVKENWRDSMSLLRNFGFTDE